MKVIDIRDMNPITKMTRVTYTGDDEQLKDETALGFMVEDGGVAIQADNQALMIGGRALGFGWHWFPITDWKPEDNKWLV